MSGRLEKNRGGKQRRGGGRSLIKDKRRAARVESLEERKLLSFSFTGSQIGAGAHSTAAVLADVNGDGVPDLVVTHDTLAGQVRIRLGNGNGTFQPAIKLAVGGDPSSVIVADLLNDGRQDIVTTDNFSGSVSVIIQTQLGTFQPAQSFATGAGPTFVAAADVNGDMHPDLVVTNSFSGTTVYLPGNGNGTFGAPLPIQVTNSTTFATASNTVNGQVVAVGDVTGDGKPDLIVNYLTASPNYYSVTILTGAGNGTFVRPFNVTPVTYNAQQVFSAVGQDPKAFVLSDVNGDGRPDLITSNYATYSSVHVLLNQGGANFGVGGVFAVGFDPDALAVADFNGDGQLDIVTANHNEQDISVLAGNGDGNFQPAQVFSLGGNNFPIFVGAGDINGDGKPDIVALNAFNPHYSISILQNTTFEAPFAHVNGHTLAITGTSGNDTITAAQTYGLITITENGLASQQFPVRGINVLNITSDNGNDSISVAPGISGGTVTGGVSIVDPGTGSDTMVAGDNETLLGASGPDYLSAGFSSNCSIVGNVGNDTIFAGVFNSSLSGGAGADSITGGPGQDSLSGGGGPDTLVAGAGNNTLAGGVGFDSMVGGPGADLLSGGAGGDTILSIPAGTSAGSAETILGGLGNDSMTINSIDFISGGGGSDTVVEQG